MNFKDLYNQKNKNELLQKIEDETFDRITISFYKYTKLENLEILRNELYLKWKKLNILGRVYMAPEGINAQISIPKHNKDDFPSGRKISERISVWRKSDLDDWVNRNDES